MNNDEVMKLWDECLDEALTCWGKVNHGKAATLFATKLREKDADTIAQQKEEIVRLGNEANYFNQKLTEVTGRHCDEIDRNFKLKGKLENAGNLVAQQKEEIERLRASLAENNHLYFAKSNAVNLLMDAILVLEGKESRPSPRQGDY